MPDDTHCIELDHFHSLRSHQHLNECLQMQKQIETLSDSALMNSLTVFLPNDWFVNRTCFLHCALRMHSPGLLGFAVPRLYADKQHQNIRARINSYPAKQAKLPF